MHSMSCRSVVVVGAIVLLVSLSPMNGQNLSTTSLPLSSIQFSGTIIDSSGKPKTGVLGITFALYPDQSGGSALWLETQNVTADEQGRYTVLLGSATPGGLPVSFFSSGQARWLAVQPQGEPEMPRVLLVSVPYALKAADADTIGGKPLSAFVLAETEDQSLPDSGTADSGSAFTSRRFRTESANVGGASTQYAMTKWLDNNGLLGDSAIFETNGNLGVGTSTPTSDLGVVAGIPGGAVVKGSSAGLLLWGPGTHELQVSGDSSSGRLGQDSNGFFFASDSVGKSLSFYTNNGSLNERMRITGSGQIGIGTQAPNYALDVQGGQINASGGLCMAGTCQSSWTTFTGTSTFTATPTGTGAGQGSLYVNPATASTGQTLLGVAVSGTQEFKVDSGGSITSNGNLNFSNDTNGSGTAGMITIAGNRFLHNFGTNNTFLGQNAGNLTMTGTFNTASGLVALTSNTTGKQNTANGAGALSSNTTGNSNTAVGWNALVSNSITADNTFSTGNSNTAIGFNALQGNTTGNVNTASGNNSMASNTTGNANTAVGTNSLGSNTTGTGNVAVGAQAGVTTDVTAANTTGSNNTFIGRLSGPGVPSASNLQNATAIGANAVVAESNALVLGSIQGINNAGASVRVGIGTTTPSHPLDVTGPFDVAAFTTGGTNDNVALQGLALGTSGQNIGVYGETDTTADDSAAVVGIAAGASGLTAGVYGQSNSPTGAGGVFSNSNSNGVSLAAMDQNQSSNFVFTVLANGKVGIDTTNPGRELEVNGGVRLNTVTAQPTCDATQRGTFWVVEGAPGVKDSVAVCAKDASDIYLWRVLY